MSKDQIHAVAQRDADEVRLPDGWPGVLAWAATKFGVAGIFSAILVWGISQIYTDQRAMSERLLEAYTQHSKVLSEFTRTLERLANAVEKK